MLLAIATTSSCAASVPPKPVPDSLTPEQKSQLIETDLQDEREALLARYPNLEVPDVVIVRVITLDEWGSTRAACMTEQGFPAQVNEWGGTTGTGNLSQDQPLALARYICNAQFPVDPLYEQPLNDSQLAFLYYYYTHELRDCLIDHGQELPDPPSEQVFIEQYGTDKTWTPYRFVSASDSDLTELNEECPQAPEGIYG
jgi:hypothetical protein